MCETAPVGRVGRRLLLALVFCFITIPSSFAQQRQVLRGHIPQIVKELNLQPVERLAATQQLYLAIGVPVRDEQGLQTFVHQLYDPASPMYQQYLTPAQFAEKFGPTEQDYEAVIAFAKANGFQVTGTHPNRLLLDVDAAAADVERAFQVRLFQYQHPTEARTFYAPDVEPSVPSGIKIVDISGLNNFARPHPMVHLPEASKPGATPIPYAGSGPGSTYRGYDFRAAYVPGTPLLGTGQNVALVQFEAYYPADIAYYEAQAGLPSVTLSNILLDSWPGTPYNPNAVVEVSLDIEMSLSMAPGLNEIFLYEGNPTNFIPNDVLSRIANDDAANQISCSWGWTGGPMVSTDNIFTQMMTQGQSFFVASGDSDAYPGSSVDNICTNCFGTPAASVNVTSVGGTTLSTLGPTNSWVSETVWNRGSGVGSSGGYSAYYSIPTWQQGVNPSNLGSPTGRNFPDVALTAENIYVRANSGTDYDGVGGTSCAAPLWAGFTALVNQQGAIKGKRPVGFLNPALYTIGTGTSYTVCFHDTTSGNNEWSGSPSAYTALTGYDLCTGWGSPTGTNLMNALVGPPANLPYLVVSGSVVSGGNGNGGIDADECNLLNITLQNAGFATATTVNATLTSPTTGVTITQPGSLYPNIAPGFLATNATPFQVSTSPSFVCGTPVSLSLVLSYAGGSTTNTFSLPTCQCTGQTINDGLSVSSPTQTGRMARNAFTSSCASPKSCPGYYSLSGSYAYNAYSLTNTSVSAVCVTVTVSTACAGNGSTAIASATYLGSFDPNNLCTSYLADLGGSPIGSGSYSFDVPPDTNVIVVVNQVNLGSYCSGYTVSVVGLPCSVDGGGACSGVAANFVGSPTNGVAPLVVTFTDTSTGSITNHFWDFGDGGTANLATNVVVHNYSTGGVYTVSEIVAGAGGSSTNTQANYIVVLTPFQAWQIQYFNSTNNPNAAPGADADGTGQNNQFKYVAGLDPTNPSSVFLLSVTNQPPHQDVLRFQPMAAGHTYTPQFNTNLVNGVWAPLAAYTGPVTNGDQISVTDTNPFSPQEFYRIEISLP